MADVEGRGRMLPKPSSQSAHGPQDKIVWEITHKPNMSKAGTDWEWGGWGEVDAPRATRNSQ